MLQIHLLLSPQSLSHVTVTLVFICLTGKKTLAFTADYVHFLTVVSRTIRASSLLEIFHCPDADGVLWVTTNTSMALMTVRWISSVPSLTSI